MPTNNFLPKHTPSYGSYYLVVLISLILVGPSMQACQMCEDFISAYSDASGNQCECGSTFRCQRLSQLPDFSKLCFQEGSRFHQFSSENSNLGVIPSGAFTGIMYNENNWNSYVEFHINLTKSGVSDISDGAFKDSDLKEKLTTLTLNSNDLTSIPEEVLTLANLKNLRISDNKLLTIPSNMHEKLTNLISLGLGKNLFTTVPSGICKLPAITNIGLGWNDIQKDLSEYLDIFVQCTASPRGVDLGWPQSTMTCSCEALYKYPSEQTSWELGASCINDDCYGEYGASASVSYSVTCDPDSYEAFRGESLSKIDTADVWEKCPAKPTDESPASGSERYCGTVALLVGMVWWICGV